jgi:coenzyme F420 hydrogenase subunit beta
LLRKAREAGYVQIEPRDASVALQSQANLIRKRGAVWGRVLTLRLLGLPAPHLRGFSMFENWLRLSLLEKIQSTAGTARRVLRRRLLRLCGKRHAKGAPRIQNQVD